MGQVNITLQVRDVSAAQLSAVQQAVKDFAEHAQKPVTIISTQWEE